MNPDEYREKYRALIPGGMIDVGADFDEEFRRTMLPAHAPSAEVKTRAETDTMIDRIILTVQLAVSRADLAELDRAMLADMYAQKAADAVEALILDGTEVT